MKKMMIIPILILIISLPAFGQDETLISGKIESGGFGGPEVKFGRINGNWEVLVGGKGGWIINHRFVLGAAGYGMATKGEIRPGLYFPRDVEAFEMGYGGVLLGFVHEPSKLIHVSVDVIIGGGAVSNGVDEARADFSEDAFFIVEPNINFILNITQKLRFGFGAGYRITSGVEYLGQLDDSDIRGESINLALKFGTF